MNDYEATVLSYRASSTICAKEIFWTCGSWTAYRPVPPAGKYPLSRAPISVMNVPRFVLPEGNQMNHRYDFAEQAALITGAASGMGRRRPRPLPRDLVRVMLQQQIAG